MLEGFTAWPADFASFYRREGCWTGETFGEMLRELADTYGARVAITSGDQTISYAALNHQVDRLAAGLQSLGIRKNDRVVVQLPNCVAFFEVVFALFRIGALPVFALPSHRSSEISYFCTHAEAKAYIIPDVAAGFHYVDLARAVKKNMPNLQHVIVAGEAEEFIALDRLYHDSQPLLPQIQAHEVAFLQLSGGSTGRSKLIPRTHDDYIYSLRASNAVCEIDQDTVYLAVLPIAHNFPLSSPGVLGVLYGGGRIVLADNPDPESAFALIEKENVTITALVPPLALRWLEASEALRHNVASLRVLQVGGAKLSAEAARKVIEKFDCTLQQVFGMAEGLVNYTRLDDAEDVIVKTQGRPMSPYDEIRIVDTEDKEVPPGETGLLLTRGPYTIRGYYKGGEHNTKAFTADGFYRTGDIARVDHAGNIIVEGRDKDQINRGGEKIAAEEVENHLLAHTAIHDAAVVAMPDAYLGEKTCVFIILRAGCQSTGIELKRFLKARGLAVYKIPDRIKFVEVFPKTPLGKVNKKALRQIVAENLLVQ